MLKHLHVKNIALIDEVELSLHHNLNIFSGETGAGKSMLIDSIQFAIGNRTSRQIIRKNQQSAYVKLIFEDTKGIGISYIEDNGIPYETNDVEIERTLYTSGRTVYKINGITSNRQTVKALAALLIDVHGQHEPQSLLDVTKHIEMLDSFGTQSFIETKEYYSKLYMEWQQFKRDLESIDLDERKRLQMKDMLEFQINEISACNLKVDEEENLKEEYELLSHAEKILLQCQRAYECLDGHGEGGAISQLGVATQSIQDVSGISKVLGDLYDQLMAIEAQAQDVSYQIRSYVDEIEYSPERLKDVQDRLDMIYRMKQKYGNSIEEILDYQKQCEEELLELVTGEQNKEELQNKVAQLEDELRVQAKVLSDARGAVAEEIQEKIDHHLHDLQMPHALFRVKIEQTELTKEGYDHVEFLIRTNLGDDLHSLSKIASGGEISRVMLAIKTVLVLGDIIETVIFDEIDTGISGVAAQKVGEKLAVISRMRQVICITHLPQIAAMGDCHYLIQKQVVEEQTKTSLNELEEEGVVKELCRLMGGLVTQNAIESAREIKSTANDYKVNIERGA